MILAILFGCHRGHDADGDGWTGMDCDGADPRVHPGAEERCNNRDDDCDGTVDEEPGAGWSWFLDADGDGYGDPSAGVVACQDPDGGYVEDGTDCNDRNARVHAGSDRECSGRLVIPSTEAETMIEDVDGAHGYLLGRALDGDYDGDGHDDLAVGLVGGAYESPWAGGVYVFSGARLLSTVYAESSDADVTLEGDTESCMTGYSAAWLGDVDGGGGDDLAVGANYCGGGNVRIVYGEDLGALGTVAIADLARTTIAGYDRQYFGDTVGGGDVDGDGVVDLVAGGRQYSSADGFGGLYVFFGRGGWPAAMVSDDADVRIRGDTSDAGFGIDAESADIDGDGLDDLVTDAMDRPAVYVYLGASLAGGADLRPEDADVAVSSETLIYDYAVTEDVVGDGLPGLAVHEYLPEGEGLAILGGADLAADTTLDDAPIRLTQRYGDFFWEIAVHPWDGGDPNLWLTWDTSGTTCVLFLQRGSSEFTADDCIVTYGVDGPLANLDAWGDVRGDGTPDDFVTGVHGWEAGADGAEVFLFLDGS